MLLFAAGVLFGLYLSVITSSLEEKSKTLAGKDILPSTVIRREDSK